MKLGSDFREVVTAQDDSYIAVLKICSKHVSISSHNALKVMQKCTGQRMPQELPIPDSFVNLNCKLILK